MAYHTLLFLIVFLPAVVILYQLAGKKFRPMVLLAAGYVFFFSFSRWLFVYLIGATVVMYFAGIGMEKYRLMFKEQKKGLDRTATKELKKAITAKKRRILFVGILFLAGTLLTVKYYNFFAENVTKIAAALSVPAGLPQLDILQPIGISFYTLQGIGYLVDVYEGKIKAERNFGKLALFMAFFPQIMEGPISRYDQTADQLYAGSRISVQNLAMGGQRIFWGLLKKIVVADRLNTMVGNIFSGYQYCDGAVIFVGAAAYTLQLYMEFSGCMDMVIGTAEIFGVTLPENFRQPFFSRNVSEFWRRWHITLGAWLKDYIFYPVSLTEGVKKAGSHAKSRFGKHGGKVVVSLAALFPVWLCNGIWHGARWSYIFFGMYYFVLILAGVIFEPLFLKFSERFPKLVKHPLYIAFQIGRTGVLVVIGELFFRAEGLKHGLLMFSHMIKNFHPSAVVTGNLLGLGLDVKDYLIILLVVAAVFVVDCLHERGVGVREKLAGMPALARWCAYYVLMLSVIIFGAYGDGYLAVELIYAEF